MPDPRISKLAKVLVQYSLDLQPGEHFVLRTSPLAEDLNLEVYKEAILAGAHVTLQVGLPGSAEIFFKNASDAQLDYISPIRRLVTETFDASLYIEAEHNTRELSGVNPERQSLFSRANAEISKIFLERAAKKELKWSLTVFPTHAMAQEADMSLKEYQEFVYNAGMLHLDDPVAFWKKEGQRQREIISWLEGREQVIVKGNNVDLSFSIKDRTFEPADGKYNFPDGEIFTGPVEESANGHIRFSYPAIYGGQEVEDIELWFENGKVIKEKASKGNELLTTLLNTDDGARYLGEWGIGTNYGIQRFTKNMLFDEKIGGTIHLAVGAGYPETGSKNDSGIHWDMLCDMAESEITVDGDLMYKDGKFVV
ncbi:MAG: aminopeptidase [Anaerolineales bacterium]|nr:aminopeptidase [Anaerolineales bacterium]